MDSVNKLLKVSGILGIIFGIIFALTLFGIPLIVGGIYLFQYSQLNIEELKQKTDTIGIWAIVMIVAGALLLLVSALPGILALVAYFRLQKS